MSDRVCLCMIVRDEEAMLPAFFKAASGLWDDLCVVDTGSTDRTVEILRGAGARIFHRPWENDFAAARNAGLEQARGDWIVFLDADEMCTPDLVKSVRAARCEASLGAATLSVHNELDNGHQTITHLLRMFRRDPSIRFEHAIHEDVVRSTLHFLQDTHRTLRRLEGHLVHLGYTHERARAMNKKTRDLGLLRKSLEGSPNDFYAWFKILELARFWEDGQLGRATALDVAPRIASADPAVLQHSHFFGEMLTLLAQGLHPDDPRAALAYLTPWEPYVRTSAAYFLRCAELCEATAQSATAKALYTHCLGLKDVTANCQLAGVRPLLGLARLTLMSQDAAAALPYIDAALQENHRDPEALLALAALSRKLGGEAAVKKMEDAYVETYGETAEMHTAFTHAAALATPDR